MLKMNVLAAKLEARAPVLRARILKMVNAAHAVIPELSFSDRSYDSIWLGGQL